MICYSSCTWTLLSYIIAQDEFLSYSKFDKFSLTQFNSVEVGSYMNLATIISFTNIFIRHSAWKANIVVRTWVKKK